MRSCKQCGNQFVSKKIDKVYCNSRCRNIANRNSMKRKLLPVSAGTRGAITELVVSTHFLSLNIPTFRALSPSCPCDLVIRWQEQLISVEVRTGYSNKSGSLAYPTKTNNMTPDIYVVLNTTTDKIVFIAKTELGQDFIDNCEGS
jgi:hypothetical protein